VHDAFPSPTKKKQEKKKEKKKENVQYNVAKEWKIWIL